MKKLYLVVFLSLLVVTAYSKEDKKDYSKAFKLVEVWLEAQKDYEQLPGLTAIVVEDQEVLWSGAFGLANAEKKYRGKIVHNMQYLFNFQAVYFSRDYEII